MTTKIVKAGEDIATDGGTFTIPQAIKPKMAIVQPADTFLSEGLVVKDLGQEGSSGFEDARGAGGGLTGHLKAFVEVVEALD